MRSLLIFLFLLLALVPAWFFNRYLQQVVQPRQSFSRLLLYLFIVLVFVAAYTFLLVWLVTKLFPPAPVQ